VGRGSGRRPVASHHVCSIVKEQKPVAPTSAERTNSYWTDTVLTGLTPMHDFGSILPHRELRSPSHGWFRGRASGLVLASYLVAGRSAIKLARLGASSRLLAVVRVVARPLSAETWAPNDN
jgi:hypothetical protein